MGTGGEVTLLSKRVKMSKLSSLSEVFSNLKLAITQNGGLRGSYLSIFRTEELKYGDCVGTDHLGNKYYENKRYAIGRSRWVVYSPQFGHETPLAKPPPERKWALHENENKSGRNDCYVPYSTTPPKIQAWQPPKN